MSATETKTLTETLASLGLTPRQIAEFEADDERAWGWILWLREQASVANPAGLLIARFRTGQEAPDPNAWRGNAKASRGSDYPTLLRCAEALVKNTGHEYPEEELLAEFGRLGGSARVGNGAMLTDADRGRLLRTAGVMRQRQESDAEEQAVREKAWTVTYYLRQVAERRLTREYVQRVTIPRLRAQGLAAGDELAEKLGELIASPAAKVEF